MKPHDLAKWLNISTSAIRSWTRDEFKSYFSPTAQGGDGSRRYFDETDARIVAFIAAMKTQSIPLDEIHATLKLLQNESWQDLPPMPPAPPGIDVELVPREIAENTIVTQRAALTRQIAILEDRVDSLEKQLAYERERYIVDMSSERDKHGVELNRERYEHTQERKTFQEELLAAKEELGELRGKLHGLTGERLLWLRVLIAVAIVAAVLLAVVVVVLLNLAGVGVG